MGPKTRHESGTCLGDVTGPGEPMSQTELPTLRGVLRHGIYLQEKKLLEEEVDRRNCSINQMTKEIREAVVNCWQQANAQFHPPVIITNKSMERKIKVAWTSLENVAWKRVGQEDSKTFQDKLDFLFNIAFCSHNILPCIESGCQGCQEKAHLQECNCINAKKIPRLELAFMMSMKASRPPGEKASMMMAGPDLRETKKQEKAAQRKEGSDLAKEKAEKKERDFQEEMKERTAHEEMLLVEDLSEAGIATTEVLDERNINKYNTMKIPNTALAAIRTDATNRQAAALTSGFVQDLIEAEFLPPGSEYLALDAEPGMR